MSDIYVMIYALPLPLTLIYLAGAFFAWEAVCRRGRELSHRKQIWCRLLCALALLFWLAGILCITVLTRQSGTLEVHRMPFHQLKEYFRGGPKELIRTLWMNVLLFVPGGLLLDAQLPRRCPCWLRAALTVLMLAVLSVGIETMQYQYALGTVEADDVLCNTLGALIGVSIHEWSRHQIRKHT